MRTEKDVIGEIQIPTDALYGIHSVRARDNFPAPSPFHFEWYRALGAVKLACYRTCRRYSDALFEKFGHRNMPFVIIEEKMLDALIRAAGEVMAGRHYEHFIVPALCGGAGTSINMNVNEIIANRALMLNEKEPGSYDIIDPIRHANVFQSTNDVIPTSLRVALMELLDIAENKINQLRSSIEALEKKHSNTIRIGYTQMQEAAPTSFGRLFSAYNDALSRDWWRISKVFERIKTVNLGGSAVGTGVAVPAFFIFEAAEVLKELTGKPLVRSENLSDATSNLDPLVEGHAILKAHAVNLEKISSDMRLLASDITVDNGFSIPPRQLGSTIMPGKINPVIPEFVIGCCHRIYANDGMIASLAGQGCLELNPYLPQIGHAFIESLKFIIACDEALEANLVRGISIDATKARERLMRSPAIATVLVPYAGYHVASEAAMLMKQEGIDIAEANRHKKIICDAFLDGILTPSNLLRLGFVPSQIMEEIDAAGEDIDPDRSGIDG